MAMAQDQATDQGDANEDMVMEEVVVTGSIRDSLESSIETKRSSDNLIEAIYAEDIGKLPDQNLAEVLENVTGVQITRRAGVGTGVQIRGTNANRVEINGVSTVGSGAGRNGINFEDVNPAIISAVEVIKAPEAKTIEGSVGGTINLKTIRPLQLTDILAHARVQFEDSELSTEGWQPRLSGAFGNRWETGAGEFGFVISGSYTEQQAVSFRPRTDRDNRASPPGSNPSEFLGIQFLVQERENDVYDTTNLATTLEWAPNDSLKFHVDAIFNEQDRAQDSYRLQASGVSAFRNVSIPTEFETVDFGVGPGEFPAALKGFIEPDLDLDDDDPNLRFSSDTGSRITDGKLFALGGEWEGDRLFASFEYATTSADTENPNLSTTLNFINPNCPLDGSSNDNCVPFAYDLSNKSLAWGINYDSPFAPSPEDLLDPANMVLDQVIVGRDTTDNSEDAYRLDFTYVLDWFGIGELDFGVRRSEASSEFNAREDRIGGFSRMVDSPNGLLFEELLIPGPGNYNAADGRNLFIRNFLLVDANRAFNDPQGTLEILQAAVLAHNPDKPENAEVDLRSLENSYYDIREDTTAFYGQASFMWGMFRGNLGLRYVDTDIESIGFGPEDADGNRQLQSTKGSYEFWLPRFNLVAEPMEDLILRFGYAEDIRRPNFNQLATGFQFDNQENSVVALGNPGLEPEQVDSIDLSVEWYFAPAAVASVGYFRKERTNIFGIDFEGAALISDPTVPGGLARETDPTCPGGGIYNPIVIPNILGDPERLGMCVDFTIPGNDPETTTQSGFEFAFQYDFSEWEDRLGWASGFGVIANYTIQDFSGGSVEDCTSGRGQAVLGDVCLDRGLLDFSEDAYNFTVYYEKYGLSARMRYTWREAFRTQDFGGGANTSGSSTFSFPVWTLDRAQLNASIFYSINEHFDVGLEGVNLLEDEIYQHCVSKSGPLCFVGYPDRRYVVSASYRF
ncbi:MAG: TonB-dependent receptor [Xanthomonadales bacterium]|nr:TonB-dependent receptor [Gammaproteobacteria bacterium]MBT8051402.1 TonB-dependent receptor [Gammaproteobacteria bacterium]MBT8056896.1 TonB-dependent receptor [Gammaproteobacteria bacterium]NNJ78913.1 TonB-dependent receptor [Xanthomonadales bacterium]NNL05916.1 TonB-dependent receptor [Xanthomonadales bacterium]